MTSLTLIVLVVMVAAAVSRSGYVRALAIAGGTPIGAALVFNGIAVPTFYFAAIGAAIGVVDRMLRRTRHDERTPLRPIPGAVPLILFAVWSIMVTLIAPLVFAGVKVLHPDGAVGGLNYGSLTTSNIAQITYLVLSVSVVVFIARSRPDPSILGIGVTIVTILSFWRFLSQLSGLPFPEGFFDNSPAFSLIEEAAGGEQRFRGILSEPAGLAGSSLVTIAFMASMAFRVTGWRRIGAIVILAMSAVMAAISTSATFVVALVILVVLAVLSVTHRFLFRGARARIGTLLVICAAALAAVWVLPTVIDIVAGVVDAKVGSSSFDERTGADARSFEILAETWGFGVGLGAHRPSSLIPALLSTTGVIGTALFAIAVWRIARGALRIDAYRPVVWGVLALMLAKVIAGPDLADSSGLLWIGLGLLAQAGTLTPSQIFELETRGARRLEERRPSRRRQSPIRRPGRRAAEDQPATGTAVRS